MRKKTKVLIIAWFLFTWLFLFAVTLKPIGTLNTLKRMIGIIAETIHTPAIYTLSDFESVSDLKDWFTIGLIGRISEKKAQSGNYSAEITFVDDEKKLASFMLSDYNLGPKGKMNWRRYKFLKFFIANPQEKSISFHIKIKDRDEKAYDVIWNMKSGNNEIILDLEDVGQFIDLSGVIYFGLYFVNPIEGFVFYLDNLRLERGDLKSRMVLSEPILKLIEVTHPSQIKKGEMIPFSAQLSLTKEIRHDYTLFIHISHVSETNKRPSKRMYFINADQKPRIPTVQWQKNQPYKMGPFNIYLPQTFPSGEYIIQMGLFNPHSRGQYSSHAPRNGMMDFRTSYPRLRYTNPESKDYIVGRFTVID